MSRRRKIPEPVDVTGPGDIPPVDLKPITPKPVDVVPKPPVPDVSIGWLERVQATIMAISDWVIMRIARGQDLDIFPSTFNLAVAGVLAVLVIILILILKG